MRKLIQAAKVAKGPEPESTDWCASTMKEKERKAIPLRCRKGSLCQKIKKPFFLLAGWLAYITKTYHEPRAKNRDKSSAEWGKKKKKKKRPK